MMIPQVNVPPPDAVPPEWIAPLIAVITITIVLGWLLKPLVRAWARRIEGGGAAGAASADELAQLRERVADLEAGHSHIAELEDRLDFAERLLSQRSQLPLLESMDTPV